MSQIKLMRERRFSPLFWTQFFSSFNDNFLKSSLIILVTFRAVRVFNLGSGELVSVAGGVFILPFFLFSATAGQLADKLEKARFIRIIKWTEVAIMALAAYGFLSEHYGFLLVVLFMMGLHSAFFGPVKFGILPQFLDESELVGGNALIEAGTFLAILMGTISGGVMAAVPKWGPLLASVTLISTAVIGLITSFWIPPAESVAPLLKVQWNLVTPTWSILKDTHKNRTVFLSVLGISWFWFFGAVVLSLFPTYCKDALHSNESVVTLFLACFSVGIGIGALLCERLSRQTIELGLVPLGSIGISLFTAELAYSAQPERLRAVLPEGFGALTMLHTWPGVHLLLVLVLLAIISGFYIVPLNALIQSRSEKSHRSRVIAGNNILNALLIVIASFVLVVFLKLNLSYPQIFLILAGFNGLVAIYIYTLIPEFLHRFIAWIFKSIGRRQ